MRLSIKARYYPQVLTITSPEPINYRTPFKGDDIAAIREPSRRTSPENLRDPTRAAVSPRMGVAQATSAFSKITKLFTLNLDSLNYLSSVKSTLLSLSVRQFLDMIKLSKSALKSSKHQLNRQI
jgi:hypothetical protein